VIVAASVGGRAVINPLSVSRHTQAGIRAPSRTRPSRYHGGTDQANLRRAAGRAASRRDGTEQVLHFGVALRRYWMARNRDEEAASLLLPVLDRPEARTDSGLFAAALVTAGRCRLPR
jgi:hypothetical protein